MVYYNIVNRSENTAGNDSPTLGNTSSELSPLQTPLTVDKKAVYSCLQKMNNLLNSQPELHLQCVEQATNMKHDITSYHEWLEKSFYMVFTEEEVRGLMDYILLHSCGPVIITDITFLKKLFEVPTALNYTSWYSNIDNMQIRSQFRNSLSSRKRGPVSSLYSTPPKVLAQSATSRNRLNNRSTSSTKKEINDISTNSPSKLEQLQQKYLNKTNSTSTLFLSNETSPTPSTLIYYSPNTRRVQQPTSLAPLEGKPSSNLAIQSKQKVLSTPSRVQYKRFGPDGVQVIDSIGHGGQGDRHERRRPRHAEQSKRKDVHEIQHSTQTFICNDSDIDETADSGISFISSIEIGPRSCRGQFSKPSRRKSDSNEIDTHTVRATSPLSSSSVRVLPSSPIRRLPQPNHISPFLEHSNIPFNQNKKDGGNSDNIRMPLMGNSIIRQSSPKYGRRSESEEEPTPHKSKCMVIQIPRVCAM